MPKRIADASKGSAGEARRKKIAANEIAVAPSASSSATRRDGGADADAIVNGEAC